MVAKPTPEQLRTKANRQILLEAYRNAQKDECKVAIIIAVKPAEEGQLELPEALKAMLGAGASKLTLGYEVSVLTSGGLNPILAKTFLKTAMDTAYEV